MYGTAYGTYYTVLRTNININNIFGVGDHFQLPKVLEGTCTFRGWGDHFQVLKVSEGTCTVLRTVPHVCIYIYNIYTYIYIYMAALLLWTSFKPEPAYSVAET